MRIQTQDELKNDYRKRREIECFSVINRGILWYNRLTDSQLQELNNWYQCWLDITKTMTIPKVPSFVLITLPSSKQFNIKNIKQLLSSSANVAILSNSLKELSEDVNKLKEIVNDPLD